MRQDILSKLYGDDLYLTYLRYHPKWYVILNEHPEAYSDFEKEVKVNLKLTTYDKIDNLRKQVDFINGILKYLNSSN
ncbi:MAG: YlbE-like family protein [Bacilli bacterium]